MQKRFALLACILLSGAGALRSQNEIVWLADYREALREAKQTHKPIFLEFRCEP